MKFFSNLTFKVIVNTSENNNNKLLQNINDTGKKKFKILFNFSNFTNRVAYFLDKIIFLHEII